MFIKTREHTCRSGYKYKTSYSVFTRNIEWPYKEHTMSVHRRNSKWTKNIQWVYIENIVSVHSIYRECTQNIQRVTKNIQWGYNSGCKKTHNEFSRNIRRVYSENIQWTYKLCTKNIHWAHKVQQRTYSEHKIVYKQHTKSIQKFVQRP